jgi:hypothetical protein
VGAVDAGFGEHVTGDEPAGLAWKTPGSTALPQMCELHPELIVRQDAPDISALAVPPLWILLRRRGMRVMALKPSTHPSSVIGQDSRKSGPVRSAITQLWRRRPSAICQAPQRGSHQITIHRNVGALGALLYPPYCWLNRSTRAAIVIGSGRGWPSGVYPNGPFSPTTNNTFGILAPSS